MGKHKKLKKHKKSSKKRASSSEDEWVEAEKIQSKETKKNMVSSRRYSSSEESSSEELIKKRKRRRHRSYTSSSSSNSEDMKYKNSFKREYDSSSSLSSGDERGKKTQSEKHRSKEIPSACSDKNKNNQPTEIIKEKAATSSKRENWMELPTSFSSFSQIDRRKQRAQEKILQKESEQYNPSKCPRELNPYWKDGGDGLPKFLKPKDDDLDEHNFRYKSKSTNVKPESNWRKNKEVYSHDRETEVSESNISTDVSTLNENKTTSDKSALEKELNLLAGKLVKAEIMGNKKLIEELKAKLEKAREELKQAKTQDDEVLLTQTDRQGLTKPLTLQSAHGGASGSKKQRKKAIDTHQDKQRVRYFPDDDNYSLKQMFENEKYNTSHGQEREFMKIASNIRKNDDLDDFFTDNVRRKTSDSKIDEANCSKAINEHKIMTESLDQCSKCIQSTSMQKHLIISMGEYVYLSVPAHEPLTEGHCLIIPIRHVSCATQLDENEWSEILDFRRGLVRLAETKDEEPIFFEIAIGFRRYPHMALECIPLSKEDGEMAPIYFKKAIDESETEWAQNKKLVSLKGRDVRRAIPKGLPYFFVSFGMEEGFAHVIEDEKMFPRNFAQEIIGGMLDLHHSKWRKPQRQSFSDQSKRVLKFSNEWTKFDCTSKKID